MRIIVVGAGEVGHHITQHLAREGHDVTVVDKDTARIDKAEEELDAIVVNGMPNFRRADGLPQRIVSLDRELESNIGKPIVSSDTALYWRIFKTLGTAPVGSHGQLLASLQ